MSSSTRDGFTLLELLIAVAVTALLVTGAVGAYLDITRAQQRARGELGRDLTAGVFLDRFERELRGSLLVVLPEDGERLDHPYLFVGTEAFGDTGEADHVLFATRTSLGAAGPSAPERLRLVSYGLVSNSALGLDLFRREDPIQPSLSRDLPIWEGQLVLEDVLSFGLRYLDEEAGDWRDAWDSTEVALLDRLPLQVEVTIRLEESDETDEPIPGPDHARVVPIPTRPIDIAKLRRQAKGTGDGCLTVKACLALLADVVEEAEAGELFEQTDMEACWSPDLPIATDLEVLGADLERCAE